MKSVSAGLALVAVSGLLAGCGGGSGSSIPKAPAVPQNFTAPTFHGPGGTLTITLPPNWRSGSSSVRGKSTIDASANSVTAYVVSQNVAANGVQYYPTAACVNLPTTGTIPVPALNVPMANARDMVFIASSTGTCATTTSSTRLPFSVANLVANFAANSGGAFNPGQAAGQAAQGASFYYTASNPPSANYTGFLASQPVVGQAGTGTVVTELTANLNGVQNFVDYSGQAVAITATLGYPVVSATITNGSLSTQTAGITTFEMDSLISGSMGLPFQVNINGLNGVLNSTAGSTVNLEQSATLVLKDNSSVITAGTLGIAWVNANGTIVNSASTDGNGNASLTINNAPLATDRFVILYRGQTQDVFQSGTVGITLGGVVQAGQGFTVRNQSQVVSMNPRNPGVVTTLPTNALSIAVSGDPRKSTAGNNFFVTVPTAVTSTAQALYQLPIYSGNQATPFTTNTYSLNGPLYTTMAGQGGASGNYTGAIFTAITPTANGAAFAVDAACAGCSATNSGIWYINPGITPQGTRLLVPSGSSLFQSTVAPPYSQGPIGIVWAPPATTPPNPAPAGTAGGTLYVYANNSIYSIGLTYTGGTPSTPTTASQPTLVAGTGTAGPTGQGSTDSSSGLTARFNQGTNNYAPLTVDAAVGTAPSNIFVVDPGTGAIRKVSLASGNATSTLITNGGTAFSGALTYDTVNKLIYLAASDNRIYYFSPSTAATTLSAMQTSVNSGSSNTALANTGLFANIAGTTGTTDGLALTAYPLQFALGNSVTGSAAGTVATQYSLLGLVANSNINAQNTAGVATYLAGFNKPTGISYDPNTGFFYELDNGSATIRVLQ